MPRPVVRVEKKKDLSDSATPAARTDDILDAQDLEAEGHGDQASAKVKQAGDKAKDAVGDALDPDRPTM